MEEEEEKEKRRKRMRSSRWWKASEIKEGNEKKWRDH